MSEKELIEKFNQLTNKIISKSKTRAIIDNVLNLDHAKKFDALCNMLIFRK